jgi:hypothetical protein
MTTFIYKQKKQTMLVFQNIKFSKLQLSLKNYQRWMITNNYRTGLGK